VCKKRLSLLGAAANKIRGVSVWFFDICELQIGTVRKILLLLGLGFAVW